MGLTALLLCALPARGETTKVRIAQQTGVAFLEFNLMKHQGLIEKHAAAHGPGLLVVWAKTWGTSQEVRGVAAMSQLSWLLNTRNPNVHHIRGFTATDRIAMPAVTVAAQSILREMAATANEATPPIRGWTL